MNDMSAGLELGLEAAEALLTAAGEVLLDRDRDLLLSYGSVLHGRDSADQDRLLLLFDRALDGFLRCATEGRVFVPVERFLSRLQGSIEAHYPGAGAGFRRLAISYWTLRMLEGRVRLRYAGIALQQLLASVESRAREIFFTDPSEDLLSSAQRTALQRRTWAESGAELDIDEFLLGNPLLVGNPLAGE